MTTASPQLASADSVVGAGPPLPRGLRLGCGHRGVPDRGRGRRGRAHPVHLGHLRPHARARSATATPATSPATTTTATRDDVALMAEPRPRRVPVLRRLAAHPARRRRRPNRAGLDFYDRLVDELLAAGIDALGHALPLGPAAGARGRRRLAGPRHRRPLRRATRRSSARRSATGSSTGPRSTSRGARRSSATARACTRPACRARRRRRRRAPPDARPRPGGAGAARGGAGREVGITLNLYPVTPADDRPRRPRRGAPGRRPAQPLVPRPGLPRASYPADVVADLGPL